MVHRLDRETSGLVVIAKTPEHLRSLRRQFRERKVEKIYLALVWGESRAEGVIDFPLAHDPRDKKRMRAMARTRRAKRIKNLASHHSRIAGFARPAACPCWKSKWQPVSRIRSEFISRPSVIRSSAIVSMAIRRAETFALQRHFLHAWKLRFDHPTESREISFEVSPPEELRAVLARLDMKV